MRFSEFSKKEVVNIRDGKCLGCVHDLIFDECRGADPGDRAERTRPVVPLCGL